MAHELEMVNGRYEAAFALKTPWHGLGETLSEVPDSATMYRAAHLDWEVGMQPINMADGTEIPGKMATYRKDTGTPLGVVSDGYGIVQNREAFDFLDSLWQDGVIRYESAFALQGGRIVCVVARMPSYSDEIANGDFCQRYILFATSHDGSKKLHAIPTSIRVVCANTLRMATQGIEGVRHSGDMKGKLSFARKFLSQFDEKFTMFRDNARKLAGIRWNDSESGRTKAAEYIRTLFPEVSESGRAKTIRDEKVSKIRRNLMSPRQQVGGIGGTWWALYNGVSELVDHQSNFKGANAAIRQQNRYLSIVDGAGAAIKDKAFDLAMAAVA